MTLADDLRAARGVIENPAHWGRGFGSYLGPSPLCAAGACRKAAIATEGETFDFLRVKMQRALQSELPTGFGGVPAFNDAPTTTHADIMALFDRAIAKAEGQNG